MARSSILFLLFCILISTIHYVTSTRVLLQSLPTPFDPSFPGITAPVDQQPTVIPPQPTTTTTPVDQQPPVIPPQTTAPPVDTQPADNSLPPLTDNPAPTEPLAPAAAPAVDIPADSSAPTVAAPAVQIPADSSAPTPAVDIPSAPTSATTPDLPPTTTPLPTAAVTTPPQSSEPILSFYMHDILGGTHASTRVVTGIITSSDSSAIPFSKANNNIFPLTNGVPLSGNQINNFINNNNAPYMTSLNGQQQQQQSTTIQNTGNSNNVVNSNTNSNAFVTAGQLPEGATLEKLMFGSITVIDDQLTEGHELGTSVIGSAQGIYLASSLDGQSHTMAYTAMFHGEGGSNGGEEVGMVDGISFFGVHRVAAPVSTVAVIGGTGKYESARGYAAIETVPMTDQLTTDGVDTIVKVSVYLI